MNILLTHIWGYAGSGDRKLLPPPAEIESPVEGQQYIATITRVWYTIANQRDEAPRLNCIAEQSGL